ncbi:uncharacterized protein LOC112552737 [Pogonomyrmex barbatus]|uniref:Uncharacterized protein LOC112552737 n=1 Tax=Pogonomyrmex barbatus TaxID=144034 RepID=A0A8N1S6G1_9HYME|nr:uncharacterized protein LOC112552737 [Pogonomyrmex barbatus]
MKKSRDLLERVAGVEGMCAYRVWEREYIECLEVLRDRYENRVDPTVTGTINSLVSRVAQLEGARFALSRRFGYLGARYDGSKEFEWVDIETAFANRVRTGAVVNIEYVEPRRFLEAARATVLERVRVDLDMHACLKVNTVFHGEFVANNKSAVKSIRTRNRQLFGMSDLREWYDGDVINVVLTSLEEFQERDSGWALLRILNLMINVNKCNPMHAGCWMSLPPKIRYKRAVINVCSNDNACFAWAVMAALYPIDLHSDRPSSYPHYSLVLNFDGIDFPMILRNITRFERLNDLSINVFAIREKRERNGIMIVPLSLMGNKKSTHVNLLYLSNERRGDNFGHFG